MLFYLRETVRPEGWAVTGKLSNDTCTMNSKHVGTCAQYYRIPSSFFVKAGGRFAEKCGINTSFGTRETSYKRRSLDQYLENITKNFGEKKFKRNCRKILTFIKYSISILLVTILSSKENLKRNEDRSLKHLPSSFVRP